MTVTTSAALAAPGESGSPVELDARYENLIGGEWVRPTNGEYRENPTPSTGETFCAVAGGRVRESDLFFFSVCAHKRLRSEYSQIRAGPAARTLTPSPDATNGATCVTRHGVWVTGFDCGAGSYVLGVIPPARWTRLNAIGRAGVLMILLARASQRFPPRS